MRLKAQIPLSANKEMTDMLEARGAVMENRDLSHDETQVFAPELQPGLHVQGKLFQKIMPYCP